MSSLLFLKHKPKVKSIVNKKVFKSGVDKITSFLELLPEGTILSEEQDLLIKKAVENVVKKATTR